MPFCIIFFVIALLYTTILIKSSWTKWLIILLCISYIIGYFVGNIAIGSVIINWISIVSTIIIVIWLSMCTIDYNKSLLFTSVIVVGLIYYALLSYNYLVSVDYYIATAAIISLLPICLYINNLGASVLYCVCVTVTIHFIDVLYWYQIIDIAQFNNSNYLNMLAILISAAIIVCQFSQFVKYVRVSKRD